ncbi:M60 family metallopeptidase [Luteolibacter marinus]|uniref:M60 family metallopeptidase n=1 Tax=Luteolibacter marinus TaxID=2776705 RepID=UPI0018673616|nr:M60 family metallopeptidase [Luteolibacter marinus]
MLLTCPICAHPHAVEIPRFPAKIRCGECNSKCLVEESGAITVLEAGIPPQSESQAVIAPLPRPVPVKSNSGAVAGFVVGALVIGTAAVTLVPAWREALLPDTGSKEGPAPVTQPQAQAPAVVEASAAPAPAPVVPAPAVEPLMPEETIVTAAEPPAPARVMENPEPAGKALTLAAAAPEIDRILAETHQRISGDPAQAESEVRAFLRGLYTPRNGRTPGGTLGESHPELLLGLLGDLWKRIEESPGATLPETPGIKIQNRSRSYELTDTYVKLLGAAATGGPVEDAALEALARDEEITKLLTHFAKGQDPSTTGNALTLGRMIFDIRQGNKPLAGAEPKARAVAIDDLPKTGRDVDLAGFDSVQELVRWAHEFNPGEKTPIKAESESEASEWTKRAKAYLNLPAEVLLPHPGSADLPGKVSDKAPRVEREVQIDLARARWQATGLYAVPGEAITLRVPSRLRGKGLQVRIGAQTDNVSRTSGNSAKGLKRFPIISNSFPLDDGRVTVGNPFGGAIYIDVPVGENTGDLRVPAHGMVIRTFAKAPAPDPQTLVIAGAVEMPWWRPGMAAADWRKELAKPAPWAEMDFGTLCLCVPADIARKAKDPQGLTEFWQTVMDAEWKFGGYTGPRVTPMRISFDRQISAGFMHSGYPIMVHLPQAAETLDLKLISERGSWGLFHEIGHNHQPLCITPKGFSESTVNLFSLAAQSAILPKRDPKLGHGALADPDALLKKRMAGETDAWTNLAVFFPLIDEFGMDSLTRMFRLYWEKDAKSGDAPKFTSEECEDQWVRRFGETVERDVCAYFESVHFHVTPATRKALSKFKPWTP